ncbi:MAG: DUF922 domain-containing protein [Betaproteobacteria bacterium]
MNNKLFRCALLALAIAAVGGCQKWGGQVMDHPPITAEGYDAILKMPLPDSGPIEQKDLLYRNKVSDFTIGASNAKDMYAEFRRKGPLPLCKTECGAAYMWKFDFKWDTVAAADKTCSVKWINAMIDSDYYVPLWTVEKEAAAPLRQAYAEWMRKSWVEMNKKAAAVVQEAALLERTVMALPAMPCDELDTKIIAEGAAASKRADARVEALTRESDAANIGWLQSFQ